MQRLRLLALAGALTTVLALGAAPVAAHEHYAENGQNGEGQVLANGQNHPRPFQPIGGGKYASCEATNAGVAYGPAWYGLETAHHGPDSGEPGKRDRCYVADGNPALGEDDQNPAIR
jgi:hypothetical protein